LRVLLLVEIGPRDASAPMRRRKGNRDTPSHALSLDPPAHYGRLFRVRFLHEEFPEVNRGVGVLPLASCAACPGS
jgi:hypothetical protein